MIILNNLQEFYKKEGGDSEAEEYYQFNHEEFFLFNEQRKKDVEKYNDKFLIAINKFLNEYVDLFLKSMGFDYKNTHEVAMLRFKSGAIRLVNFKDEETRPKKYAFILQNMVGNELYSEIQNLDYCQREAKLHEYYYAVINLLKIHLMDRGCVFFAFFNNCVNSRTIEICFILSTMFEKVFIINSSYVYCFNFLNRSVSFEYPCSIEFADKQKMKTQMVKFCVEDQVSKEKMYKLYIGKKYDEFIDLFIFINSEFILKLINYNDYLHLQLLSVKRLVFKDENVVRLSSNINYTEGTVISHIIKKYKCKKCLEVGFAFGVSSSFILKSSDRVTLISIDPNQSSQWNNNGLKLLKKLNVISRHTLIEKKSHHGLPMLLSKLGENSFDFVFIDGFHTFDYTLLDVFFAAQLLKLNGILIIDDCLHKAVSRVVNYIDTNYNNFLRKIIMKQAKTIAIYMKFQQDNRSWDFHRHF